MVGIIEAAITVRRRGDVAREFRRLKPPFSYECFRLWVRRIRMGFRISEFPPRGESYGVFL